MRFGVFLRLSPSVGVALTNRHGCGSAPRSPHPAAGLVTPCRQSLRTRLSLAPAAFASLRFRMWWFPLFRTPSGDRRHCHSRDPSRMPTPHFTWVPSASAARPLRCCTSRRHPTRPSLSLARFRLCACTPAPGLPVLQLSTPAHVPPSVPGGTERCWRWPPPGRWRPAPFCWRVAGMDSLPLGIGDIHGARQEEPAGYTLGAC